ncbi:MAG: DUF2183 domain-containing protein [Propionibacteriaceae bacterium]|nr:DUF2183 domain-containing protein [Propionibacteriaceae bacterium]
MRSNRPFFAARVEEFVERRLERMLRGVGWKEWIDPYTGYGSERMLRIFGRVLLRRKHAKIGFDAAFDEFARRTGIRNYVTVSAVDAEFNVRVGDQVVRGVSDRQGYIDIRIHDHGLRPGWHTVEIFTDNSEPALAPVLVIGDDQDFGIISDVDDTMMVCWLPRILLAGWNAFVRNEYARQAIPGMAHMYRTLSAEHGGAPVIYVSTGSWNTHSFLTRFFKRHRIPLGPILLTDWGPTNTGWFRSGAAQKATYLLELAADFPQMSWLLVGDNGQRDPETYSDFIRFAPDKVRAVAIRQLSPTEHVLAHLSADVPTKTHADAEIPWVEAPDGRGLLRQLRTIL